MRINKEKLLSIAAEENQEEKRLAEDAVENGALHKASMRIAMKIKRALRKAGMTQAQLAERLGTDPAIVSRLLNGKANMELKTMVRFEEILGINIIDRSISPHSAESDTSHTDGSCAETYIPALWSFTRYAGT